MLKRGGIGDWPQRGAEGAKTEGGFFQRGGTESEGRRSFLTTKHTNDTKREGRRTAAWAVVALAAGVLVEAGVRGWYGSRESVVAQSPGWDVKWPAEEREFRTYPLAERARDILKPDDFSSAAWRTEDGDDRSGYYILWDTGQQARNMPFLHGPEICLPLSGIELVGRKDPVTIDVDGVELPFDVYEFRQHERPMYLFRIVWNPDEARAASAPRDTDGWDLWLRERWADVAARRVAIRAQVLTLAVSGEKNHDEAVAAFREEAVKIIRPAGR